MAGFGGRRLLSRGLKMSWEMQVSGTSRNVLPPMRGTEVGSVGGRATTTYILKGEPESGVSLLVLTYNTQHHAHRQKRFVIPFPLNTLRRMQASLTLWSAFCIAASAAVDEGLVGGCIYGNMLVRYHFYLKDRS